MGAAPAPDWLIHSSLDAKSVFRKNTGNAKEGNSHHTWWYVDSFNPVTASEIEIVI